MSWLQIFFLATLGLIAGAALYGLGYLHAQREHLRELGARIEAQRKIIATNAAAIERNWIRLARDRDRSANADRREAAGPEGQEPGPRSGIAQSQPPQPKGETP